MTRFIFLSSFLFIERNMRYYLFPGISFFFGCETVATRTLRVRIRAFWGETSHFAWNSFSGRALFTGFDHNWCGARAFNVCHVVDADRHSHISFPRFRTTIAWFTNVRIYRSVVTAWLDIYWARVSLLIGLFLWQLFLQKYYAIDFTFFLFFLKIDYSKLKYVSVIYGK